MGSSVPRGRPALAARLSLALAMLALAIIHRTAHADIQAALLPAATIVSPGTSFTIELDVTQAGTDFNGYDTVIEFDPTQLQFQPTSPLSLQEGAYMRNACGQTFQYFTANADSLLLSHGILCPNTSLSGPGQLYRLNFKALAGLTNTYIRIRRLRFANDGIFVGPVAWGDARVTNTSVGVPDGAPPHALHVSVAPNPCRMSATISIDSPESGEQRVTVYDVTGRAVRHLQSGTFGSGTRRVMWDGRNDAGVRLAPGCYRAVVSARGTRTETPLIVAP